MKFWLKQPLREKAGDGSEGTSGDGKPTGVQDPPPEVKLTKEQQAAVSLYQALQDPETSSTVIEHLARKAGLLTEDKNKGGDDKKDDKKKSFSAAKLKAKLGKDYEKFADAIGPAFDDIIEERLAELTTRNTQQRETDRWTAEVDKFMGSYELTEEIESAMKDLMADSPPAVNREGFNAQRYLTRMYNQACAELDIEPKKAKGKGKRSRAEDIDDAELPDIREVEAPKSVSISDAVDAALKGIRFKRK